MNVAMLTSIIIIVIVTNKNSIDAFLPPGSVLFCFFGHILQFFSLTYSLTGVNIRRTLTAKRGRN